MIGVWEMAWLFVGVIIGANVGCVVAAMCWAARDN
jgi:hypothetical protein